MKIEIQNSQKNSDENWNSKFKILSWERINIKRIQVLRGWGDDIFTRREGEVLVSPVARAVRVYLGLISLPRCDHHARNVPQSFHSTDICEAL